MSYLTRLGSVDPPLVSADAGQPEFVVCSLVKPGTDTLSHSLLHWHLLGTAFANFISFKPSFQLNGFIVEGCIFCLCAFPPMSSCQALQLIPLSTALFRRDSVLGQGFRTLVWPLHYLLSRSSEISALRSSQSATQSGSRSEVD